MTVQILHSQSLGANYCFVVTFPMFGYLHRTLLETKHLSLMEMETKTFFGECRELEKNFVMYFVSLLNKVTCGKMCE